VSSLKIVDFGLATFMNVNEYMFPKCGTPGFVAPEILYLTDRKIKYTAVCDVFSAGVVFYKLLTGKNLFTGEQAD
jgi:calcium-dependent protein kinase